MADSTADPFADDDGEALVRVHRVKNGDLEARVSSIDGPDGRAFVLVAGIGVAANYYENLAPVLSTEGSVYALDLPGFAGVKRPHGRISMERYADVVEAALDELGLDDPVLIGHSMGTQVVTLVAARRPQLSTLILIGPVVDMRARRLVIQAVRFVRSSVREPLAVAFLATSAYLLCGFGWFFRVLPVMMRFRMEEVLPRVGAHVLIIRGEYDYVAPRGWVEHLTRLAPQGASWEIENAAHSVMHSAARGVARLAIEEANTPFDERNAHDLEVMTEREAATPDPTGLDWRLAIAAIVARIREMRASAKDDDRAIERAKSKHARVQRAVFEDRTTDE